MIPMQVINNELANFEEELNVTREDVDRTRHNLYRNKRAFLLPLPSSRQKIHDVLNEMTFTNTREKLFMLKNDIENGFVIFGYSSNLLFLRECSKISADGTFNCCTKFKCSPFADTKMAIIYRC